MLASIVRIIIEAAILLILEKQFARAILRILINAGTSSSPIIVSERSLLVLKRRTLDYAPREIRTAAVLVLFLVVITLDKFSICLHRGSIKYLCHHDIITFSPGRPDLHSLHLIFIFLERQILGWCNGCLIAILQLNVLKLYWFGLLRLLYSLLIWCFCLTIRRMSFKVKDSLAFCVTSICSIVCRVIAGRACLNAGTTYRFFIIGCLAGEITDQLCRRCIRNTYSTNLICCWTLRIWIALASTTSTSPSRALRLALRCSSSYLLICSHLLIFDDRLSTRGLLQAFC